MKKLKLALPALFLAVSSIAYGEGICSPHDFICKRHWAIVENVQPVVYVENDNFRKIRSSFIASSSRFSDIKEKYLSLNMNLFGKEFTLVLTDNPGKVALQLRKNFK